MSGLTGLHIDMYSVPLVRSIRLTGTGGFCFPNVISVHMWGVITECNACTDLGHGHLVSVSDMYTAPS